MEEEIRNYLIMFLRSMLVFLELDIHKLLVIIRSFTRVSGVMTCSQSAQDMKELYSIFTLEVQRVFLKAILCPYSQPCKTCLLV